MGRQPDNSTSNTATVNIKNYQTILPEHEVFPIQLEDDERSRNDYLKLTAAIILALTLLISAEWNRSTSATIAADTRMPAKVLSVNSVKEEMALSPERTTAGGGASSGYSGSSNFVGFGLDAHYDHMEELKREVGDAWGPFWDDSREHWAEFKETFGNKAEEKAQIWWGEFSASRREWNGTTVHWWDSIAHNTNGWRNKTESKTSGWWDHEKLKSGEAWNHTEEWFEEREHKSAKKLNHAGDKEEMTGEWFNETEHKTGHWVSKEEHGVSSLFNEPEHKTGHWLHHVGDAIKNKAEDTKNWFNDSEHEMGDWWYNETHHKSMADYLIYMNTTAAYRLLNSGGKHSIDFAQDYFLIQQGYDAQMNQAYCPVATSAAIVNSLRGLGVELPIDPLYDPYAYATQINMFNDCTNANVIHMNASYDGLFTAPYGLGMPQTKAMLECHLDSKLWNVTAHHLDPILITMETFRHDMQQALSKADSRVMINYHRKAVTQSGGGHWSPIGAYSPNKDAFLVMDVAKYKYPNAWISTSLLYKSLQTYDTCGLWDFPNGQDSLPKDYLHPKSSFHMMNAMNILGCRSTRRGYITIEKMLVNNTEESITN